VLWRRCCWCPAPTAVNRYLLTARSQPISRKLLLRLNNGTDGRTPKLYIDLLPDTTRAVSVECRRNKLPSSVLFSAFGTRNSAIAEGRRDASCQLKSCQLPRNSAETTCTTSPEEIEVMKLEDYTGPMCNKHVHSTVTRSCRFHCPIGVINKPTTDELWISPVYRRLAVEKCSKSTM